MSFRVEEPVREASTVTVSSGEIQIGVIVTRLTGRDYVRRGGPRCDVANEWMVIG